MAKLQNPVQLAVVGAPHGIKGELRVKAFTADPLALGDYGPLHAEDGRHFTVVSIRPAKDVVVVRFREVADRNAAEELVGAALFIDRARLPDDLEEDEFYQADLVGLAVRDETGSELGKVMALQNFGGGDILEVMLAGRRLVMVPFTRAAVPVVSVADGFIQIDSLAAGLAAEEEGEGDEADHARPPIGGGER